MKNPLNGIHIFLTYPRKDKGQKNMIVVRYGTAARAFDGFGDRVIGTATGYGYDKVHTALQSGIERLYQVNLPSSGAAGFTAVKEGASACGIIVEEFAGAYGWR